MITNQDFCIEIAGKLHEHTADKPSFEKELFKEKVKQLWQIVLRSLKSLRQHDCSKKSLKN